jgi:hypothetical protein
MFFPYFMLGVNLALDGRGDEARSLPERGFAIAPWFKPIVGFLAALLTRDGETDRAEMLLRQLSSDRGYVDPIGRSIFHLLCGEIDRTADWVERAIEEQQTAVLFFLSAHAQVLRSSARWPKLARMMNLSQ